jgi:hypothetical protein
MKLQYRFKAILEWIDEDGDVVEKRRLDMEKESLTMGNIIRDVYDCKNPFDFVPMCFRNQLEDDELLVFNHYKNLFKEHLDDNGMIIDFNKFLQTYRTMSWTQRDFLVDTISGSARPYRHEIGEFSLGELMNEIDRFMRLHERDIDLKRKGLKTDRLCEADIEEMLIKNVGVIETGMKLIDSQYRTKDGVIDVLTEDANGKKCIIELKDNGKDERIVFQCINYPRQFKEPVRMITLCPNYSPKIREALKSLEYVELKRFEIRGKDLIVYDDKGEKKTA